ncbi:MAG: hypothetical protein LKI25_06120 [Atopobiaceae bacterium]|jgi:membrane protein implicated in regulation of membrane protease activity|nr:hypothetical protein [Atopobiaceae bacterium]MCI2173773.1 hypothetical protein [Atopobiaceae bacterium]MCI2207585.1 hypothetical protein [Atopobiaceae bacterium]
MTLVNLISFVVLLGLAVASVVIWRRLSRIVHEADGVIDINERGSDGISETGSSIGSAGEGDQSGDG